MLTLWLSVIASAFLDNIPFVATMIPLIEEMGARASITWSRCVESCARRLPGGTKYLRSGASADLVAAGLSAKEGHPIRS